MQNIIVGEIFRTGYDVEAEIEKIKQLKDFYAQQKGRNLETKKDIVQILKEEEGLESEVNETYIIENYDNDLDAISTWRNGDSLSIQRRIYNGKRTKIRKYPFMASVEIFGKFQCGASIIKSDLVITAASCLQLAWNNRFYRENPAFLTVRVGSSFYEVGGEQIEVLEIYFHPSYNPKSLHHNIAIMRLLRKLNFKKKDVKKIQIGEEMRLRNGKVEVLGWGAHSASNNLHGPLEDKLRTATLDVYDLEDCQEIYSKEYVTPRNFCAGFISVGSGACNRDAGGPGIMSDQLVGIISFGSNVCGKPDAPTVFTKISYYEDWISDIMEQNVRSVKKESTTTSKPRKYSYKPYRPLTTIKKWAVSPIVALSSKDVKNQFEFSPPKTNGTQQLPIHVDSLSNYVTQTSQATESLIEIIYTSIYTMVSHISVNEPRPVIKKQEKKRTTKEKLTTLQEQQNTPKEFDTTIRYLGTMLYDFEDFDSDERKTVNKKNVITRFEPNIDNEMEKEEIEVSSKDLRTETVTKPTTAYKDIGSQEIFSKPKNGFLSQSEETVTKPSSVFQNKEIPRISKVTTANKDIRSQEIFSKPKKGFLSQSEEADSFKKQVTKNQFTGLTINTQFENTKVFSASVEHQSSQSEEEVKSGLQTKNMLHVKQTESPSKEVSSAESQEDEDQLTTKAARFKKVTRKMHAEPRQMEREFQPFYQHSVGQTAPLEVLMDSEILSANEVPVKRNDEQPQAKPEDGDNKTYDHTTAILNLKYKPVQQKTGKEMNKKLKPILNETRTQIISGVRDKPLSNGEAIGQRYQTRTRKEDILGQAEQLQKLQERAETLLQNLKYVQEEVISKLLNRRAQINQTPLPDSYPWTVLMQAQDSKNLMARSKGNGRHNHTIEA